MEGDEVVDQSCRKICHHCSSVYRLHHIFGDHVENATFLPLHYDADVAVSWFREGGGSVRIEGRYYPITAGDVILLNPQELHSFQFQSGYHDRLTLYIREDLVKSFPEPCPVFFDVFYHRTAGPGNHICAERAEQMGVHWLLEHIRDLTESEDTWSSMLSICKIVELVSVIGQIRPEEQPAAEADTPENPLITQVLQYINQQFLDIPDVDHLAARFFLNSAYLCRLFKSCVGISIWTRPVSWCMR